MSLVKICNDKSSLFSFRKSKITVIEKKDHLKPT